jgi:hypothetical protein
MSRASRELRVLFWALLSDQSLVEADHNQAPGNRALKSSHRPSMLKTSVEACRVAISLSMRQGRSNAHARSLFMQLGDNWLDVRNGVQCSAQDDVAGSSKRTDRF